MGQQNALTGDPWASTLSTLGTHARPMGQLHTATGDPWVTPGRPMGDTCVTPGRPMDQLYIPVGQNCTSMGGPWANRRSPAVGEETHGCDPWPTHV